MSKKDDVKKEVKIKVKINKTISKSKGNSRDKLKKLEDANKKLIIQKSKLMDIIENLKKSQIKTNDQFAEAQMSFKSSAMLIQSKANEQLKNLKLENDDKLNKEVAYVKKYGSKNLISSIIEPLNNLEMAINFGSKSTDQQVKNYVVGFKMIINQLEAAFMQNGISKIVPIIGEEFNHKLHEAIHSEENSEMRHKIIKVQKNGYLLHEVVVKPATVVIGK